MNIELINISKTYGDQLALNNVTLKAERGEIIGLLGPNGAGKTTIMKIISGYISADSGELSVMGHHPVQDNLALKHNIGYLPEHNPLYKSMYVREYLDFVAQIHKIKNKQARISEIIESTGLSREQNKRIFELSKGYKQRVGIAQAIIHNPDVLILDEPISGLDPNQIVDIRELIRSLSKDKIVIFSSHILQEVESLCDRILILDKGELIVDKAVEEVTTLISHRPVVVVEFKNEVDKHLWQHLDQGIKFRTVDNIRFEIYEYQLDQIQEKLFDWAVNNQNKIIEMFKQSDSLENAFKSLTQNN